jgi:hypothetical protein
MLHKCRESELAFFFVFEGFIFGASPLNYFDEIADEASYLRSQASCVR